jgi:hypothetical protein
MQLGPDIAILFAPKSAPHFLRPVDYWRLPEAFSMYPGLLSDPPFEYERNPLEKKSTARSALEPLPPPPQDHTPASEPSPSGWQKLRRWLNSEPNRKPKAPKSPAPAPKQAPEETRSGSPNYDPEYYSPWKIAEREAAAAKEREKSPPPTPPTDKRPPIDYMLYSDLNPDRIPGMKPPWEKPPEDKPAVTVEPAEAPKKEPPVRPASKKKPLTDGEFDIESDTFKPFRKPDKGDDG